MTNSDTDQIRSAMLVNRHAVGALTAEGHRYSNLDEMLQNRETATGDALANLNYQIGVQLDDLAALSDPKGNRGGES